MSKSLNVLVAEDNILVALDLKRAVEDLNCKVCGPFATVAESLDAVTKHDLDYALLDVELKDGRAFTIAKLLDEKKIPYVFVTGRGDLLREAGYGNGDLISKPFEIEDLISRIGEIRR